MTGQYRPTTGIAEVDRAIGGVTSGDNLVWEIDSGVAGDHFISNFVEACEEGEVPVVYVSFNRSPQTITSKYAQLMAPGRFSLIDCFSSGKGNSDEVFLKFFDGPGREGARRKAIRSSRTVTPCFIALSGVSWQPIHARTSPGR